MKSLLKRNIMSHLLCIALTVMITVGLVPLRAEAYTTTKTIKNDQYGTVVVPIDKTKVDLKSGFFKVELEEVP